MYKTQYSNNFTRLRVNANLFDAVPPYKKYRFEDFFDINLVCPFEGVLLWIKDHDCQKNTRLYSPNLLLHENMAANRNHEDCRLLYNKMKPHCIYDTMNYTVTRYVTQHSQCLSVQPLAYFAMSFTPQVPLHLNIKYYALAQEIHYEKGQVCNPPGEEGDER